jgi:hypothetical protein
MCTAVPYSLAKTPQPPPPLPALGLTRELLVSKGRRHLFVTPWQQVKENVYVCVAKVAQRRRGHESPEGTGVGGSQGSLTASSAGQGPPPPSLGGGLGGAGALQVGTPFFLHFIYSIFQYCGSGSGIRWPGSGMGKNQDPDPG